MLQQLSRDSLVRRAEGQVFTELEGEVVLLNIETGRYYGMNAVLSRIWNLIGDGPVSVSDLVSRLLEEYEISSEECERDLLEALERLKGEELLIEG